MFIKTLPGTNPKNERIQTPKIFFNPICAEPIRSADDTDCFYGRHLGGGSCGDWYTGNRFGAWTYPYRLSEVERQKT